MRLIAFPSINEILQLCEVNGSPYSMIQYSRPLFFRLNILDLGITLMQNKYDTSDP